MTTKIMIEATDKEKNVLMDFWREISGICNNQACGCNGCPFEGINKAYAKNGKATPCPQFYLSLLCEMGCDE